MKGNTTNVIKLIIDNGKIDIDFKVKGECPRQEVSDDINILLSALCNEMAYLLPNDRRAEIANIIKKSICENAIKSETDYVGWLKHKESTCILK